MTTAPPHPVNATAIPLVVPSAHGEFSSPRVPTGLFIGGEWRDAEAASTFPVEDPATGEPLCEVSDATPADGLAALDAAAAAQDAWAMTPSRERAELLRRAFETLIARRDHFATIMTLEMGKPLAEARGEVAYAAEFLRWFSEEAPRVAGRYQPAPDGRSHLLVTKRPVGPSLFITPWNFPLAMITRKVAPAIAAGCTSVLKPAALTPLSALAFVALLEEIGLPSGVVNIVPSSQAGALTGPLLADRRLRKLSFTGSTAVGRALLAAAAPGVLRTSMELGGNAPFIIFDDADLDLAVEAAVVAKLRNMGEACTAANRFYVHKSLAADFTNALAEKFSALRVGPGMLPASNLGPLIDERSRAGVHALVADAVSSGARLVTGGQIPAGAGWFYPPTVITDVPQDAPLLTDEIFGPVAPVVSFQTEDEAVTAANASDVGLAGYVITRDIDRVLRLSQRLEVGMLGVNQGVISNPAAPFGGVKQSGLGREGGIEGVEEFLETMYVGIGG
jgi:succinate-semialdehyde dehydrogenase/glutarate-semialdehyde dehydrogenase